MPYVTDDLSSQKFPQASHEWQKSSPHSLHQKDSTSAREDNDVFGLLPIHCQRFLTQHRLSRPEAQLNGSFVFRGWSRDVDGIDATIVS
jgi:hypothetical protein